VQGFGVQHELPSFGRGGWQAIDTLQPNSCGVRRCLCRYTPPRARAASGPSIRTDAALGGGPAVRDRAADLEIKIALDLATDVLDDAAEPGGQEFELPPGALELVGLRIAPHHDGGAWVSRASVGCAIAFSWRVISSTTRSRSLLSIAPVALCHRTALLQERRDLLLTRRRDDRTNGAPCWNTTSAHTYWNSEPPFAQRLIGEVVQVLEGE
jgi:hypothetical protein